MDGWVGRCDGCLGTGKLVSDLERFLLVGFKIQHQKIIKSILLSPDLC